MNERTDRGLLVTALLLAVCIVLASGTTRGQDAGRMPATAPQAGAQQAPGGPPPDRPAATPRADDERLAADAEAAALPLPDLTPGAATFDGGQPSAIDVLRARTGHLLVRPAVNGHDAGWFIFDTGAGICVVSTPHAAALGLEQVGTLGAVGIGGGQVEPLYRADSVRLGPLLLRDHPLMGTDLTFLAEHLGEEIAGVVGFGLLARCVAEVDLAAPRLSLHDPQGYALPAGEWAPMSLDGRVPSVAATFEGHEGLFRLDLGANSTLTFHEPAVRRFGLLDGRPLGEGRLGGVGGFVAARTGVLASFELAGVRREQLAVEFAIEPKGTFADPTRTGNIGAGLLQAYEIVLDYGGERLALRPRGG